MHHPMNVHQLIQYLVVDHFLQCFPAHKQKLALQALSTSTFYSQIVARRSLVDGCDVDPKTHDLCE
jgi:hypothetical protein